MGEQGAWSRERGASKRKNVGGVLYPDGNCAVFTVGRKTPSIQGRICPTNKKARRVAGLVERADPSALVRKSALGSARSTLYQSLQASALYTKVAEVAKQIL